jgi:hypothetical protein
VHVLVESVAGTKSGVQTMSERRYPGSGREATIGFACKGTRSCTETEALGNVTHSFVTPSINRMGHCCKAFS